MLSPLPGSLFGRWRPYSIGVATVDTSWEEQGRDLKKHLHLVAYIVLGIQVCLVNVVLLTPHLHVEAAMLEFCLKNVWQRRAAS